MKKVLHKITYTILSIFLFCVLLAVDFASTAKGFLSVVAEENAEVVSFDKTDISDDLKDLDLTVYPKDENGNQEVVLFMEYCYSERSELAEKYGLYLYVYNPTEKAIRTVSTANVANMATKYNAEGEPSAYSNIPLLFLDKTENNRFFKFKVKSSASFLTRSQSYATAHEGKRRYDIAGVQLVYLEDTLESKDEKVAKTYRYTGFAKGYGDGAETKSTLECKVEKLTTLSLDVHPTYYRPEGNNGTNKNTLDTLHSVYFAVPNEYIEQYGEMTAISARWLSATLSPYLVTGNETVYQQLLPYLGEYVDGGSIRGTSKNNDIDYALIATMAQKGYRETVEAAGAGYYAYNFLYDYLNGGTFYDNLIYHLYLAFHAENGNVDTYSLASEILLERMKDSASNFGGELIEGAKGSYSRAIFESIDEIYTERTIKADEQYKLTSNVISQTWWEKWLGLDGSEVATETFNNIQAIYPVKTSDYLLGGKSEISTNLYIAESDVANFVDFCIASEAANKTVFLFRYRTSEYKAYEVTEYKHSPYQDITGTTYYEYEVVDSNAYFAQQDVDLNFDIIDVTFTKGDIDTVIPVVANPLDIVHDGEPPPDIKPECECWIICFQCPDGCECGVECTRCYIPRIVMSVFLLLLLVVAVMEFISWLANLRRKK